MRDAQRSKLYTAEQKLRHALDRGARGGDAGPALERKWGSLTEVQDYVNRVTDGMGLARVEVVPRSNKHRFSSMSRREHRMNLIMEWGARELVVLHELGHYITYAPLPSHGPHFAQAFIDLVAQWSLGGDELAGRVQEVYRKGAVAYGRTEANAMALRELRNITNGTRGTGIVRMITEAPQETFSDQWTTTAELRSEGRQGAIDRNHLVAIGISR